MVIFELRTWWVKKKRNKKVREFNIVNCVGFDFKFPVGFGFNLREIFANVEIVGFDFKLLVRFDFKLLIYKMTYRESPTYNTKEKRKRCRGRLRE